MKQNIKKIKQIAKERYYKKDFGYHILPVVKNAMLLAENQLPALSNAMENP